MTYIKYMVQQNISECFKMRQAVRLCTWDFGYQHNTKAVRKLVWSMELLVPA